MEITIKHTADTVVFTLQGRLDAYGAKGLDEQLLPILEEASVTTLVMDFQEVNYLSSAGVRSLLKADKHLRPRQGRLLLAGLNEYCRNVLDMAGYLDAGQVFDTPEAALKAQLGFRTTPLNWDGCDSVETDAGRFRFRPHSNDSGTALVLGHIEDVLDSRVTPDHIQSKQFSHTEYSIGLGGLGDRLEDYFPVMGEMITIGGTMVWLPTDGNDTPDYLIPKHDTGSVRIRTGFNVALDGDFNELVWFESQSEQGATIADIYRGLFASARQRRPEYKGGIALAMRADMSTMYGSGVLLSPVIDNQPANGEWITHPSNFPTWFEVDKTPRKQDVTGLLTGIGIDLTADRSAYDKELFDATFYVNPANPSGSDIVLHNHGVFFDRLPANDQPGTIKEEIAQVIETGTFVDMRHLLDGSEIRSALIGVSYLQQFAKDPAGEPSHS